MRKIRVIRTRKNESLNFRECPALSFDPGYRRDLDTVFVDPAETFQTYLGMGGAFTEASAYTLSKMSLEKQREAIRLYFDPTYGIGYTLGRVSVHSCDFSLGNYTYIREGDTALSSFDMSHEEMWLLPMLRAAKDAAGSLELMASPWSPPAFMKTNLDMNYGGRLKKEYYDLWARYLVRYLEGMKNYGFPISYMSTQNEPNATQTWDSCLYTGNEEAEFLRTLYPRLDQAGFSDLKLLVWDLNRDHMVRRANEIFRDPELRTRVWGVAFHWYTTEQFSNPEMTHRMFPEKHLLFTEGCVEMTPKSYQTRRAGEMGCWEHGEVYSRNIISDFNNGNEGFIDWNLFLNTEGGPNHVGNFCEAPIQLDPETDTIHINPSYYHIGHIARYVRPGAKRLLCMNDTEDLHSAAFCNPDGTLTVILQNPGGIREAAVVVGGEGFNICLPDCSLTTLIIEN